MVTKASIEGHFTPKNPQESFCSEKIEMSIASILLNSLCKGSAKAAVMEQIL